MQSTVWFVLTVALLLLVPLAVVQAPPGDKQTTHPQPAPETASHGEPTLPASPYPAKCGALPTRDPCRAPGSERQAKDSPNPVWSNVSQSIHGGPFGYSLGGILTEVVYDAADACFMAFVLNGTGTEGTFALGVNGWKQVHTATGPESRQYAAVAYDPAIGKVVLFGGYNYTFGGWFNDTWEYGGGHWTRVEGSGGSGPGARYFASLAYDPALVSLVLFGGFGPVPPPYGSINYFHDTWAFSASGWSRVSTTGNATAPGGWPSVYAYDIGTSSIVTFGGDRTNGAPSRQTWTFTGRSWNDRTNLSAPTPPGSYGSGSVDLPSFGGVLAWGGSDGIAGINQTWRYVDGNWTNLTGLVGASPHPTYASHLLVSGASDAYALLFEGVNGTWLLGPQVALMPLFSPQPVDVGEPMNLSVEVVSALSGIRLDYSGLPPGCLSANSSALYCTSTAPGEFRVNVTATTPSGNSSSVTAWLNVSPRLTLSRFTASPDAVTLGSSTNLSVQVSGGSYPVWIDYPHLPPGCASANSSVLSCTPSTTGTFVVEVWARDITGAVQNASLNLTVNPRPGPVSLTASPGLLEVGQPLSIATTVTGGTSPLTYDYARLPPGCSATSSAELNCTPTGAGNFSVVVTVTDALGWSASAATSVTVVPALALASAMFSPNITDVGRPVTLTASVTGGAAPILYSLIGFPGSCTFSGASATVCYPQTPGTYSVTVSLSDSLGGIAGSGLALTVHAPPALAAHGDNGSISEVGLRSTISWSPTNGTSPESLVVQGLGGAPLPAACRLSTEETVICDWTAAGNFSLVGSVEDGVGAVTQSTFTIVVVGNLRIATLTVDPSIPLSGVPFTVTSVTVGGLGPLLFSYGGDLSGCAISSGPSERCSAAQGGSYRVSVRVTDSLGVVATGNRTVDVTGALLGVPLLDWALVGAATGAAAVAVVVLVRRRHQPASATGSQESTAESFDSSGTERNQPDGDQSATPAVMEPDLS